MFLSYDIVDELHVLCCAGEFELPAPEYIKIHKPQTPAISSEKTQPKLLRR